MSLLCFIFPVLASPAVSCLVEFPGYKVVGFKWIHPGGTESLPIDHRLLTLTVYAAKQVDSADSFGIVYGSPSGDEPEDANTISPSSSGCVLSSGTQQWWRVKLWDEQGEVPVHANYCPIRPRVPLLLISVIFSLSHALIIPPMFSI